MGGSSSSEGSSFDFEAQLLADKTLQSVEVKDDESKDDKKDCTLPRRNIKSKDGLVRYPLADSKDSNGGLKTIWECFQHAVSKHPKNNFLGGRLFEWDEEKKAYKRNKDNTISRGNYAWLTYAEADKEIRDFGSGLMALGAQEKDAIGVYSINRPEWMVACLGFHSQNMKTVSLYATLGNDAVEYIINHADISIVVTEKANVKHFVKLAKNLPKLKVIVQIDYEEKWGNREDNIEEKDVAIFNELKINLIGMSAVKKLGSEKVLFPKPPQGDDLAYIMYTSGTTGAPKGAMLRHSDVVASVASVGIMFPLLPTDIAISYLPLAHIFECVVEAYVTCSGAAIGFYQGEVTKLTEDCQVLKPTMFMGVPRVFSKIYQKIFSTIDEKNCLVKFVVHRAFNGQAHAVRNKLPVDEANDKKIFAPIRAKLGLENVRLIVSGAAPCPPYVIEFLRIICKEAQILQGYGMTETAAGISIVTKGDITMGHCGPPVPCNEVKLRDVPEMNYLHTDANPRGEILVRGPNIFAGYYKNEKATSETIEAGGWLATGDIGRFNPNGTLSIIDRKKNIFKLSQGEYIAAERVETVYGKSAAVGQVWVYGNSFKSFVLAVVVPSGDWSKTKGTELGFWTGGPARPGEEKFIAAYKALYTGSSAAAMKKALVDEMNKENSHLKGFEKVKDVIIETDIDKTLAGFTIENDCLTPSFKLKRPQLLKKYVKELKNAYKVNGEAPGEGEKWPGEDS